MASTLWCLCTNGRIKRWPIIKSNAEQLSFTILLHRPIGNTSVVCNVFLALYGVSTALRHWTVPIAVDRRPNERTVVQFSGSAPCVRTPWWLKQWNGFECRMVRVLGADNIALTTAKKLTIQYINEQPKIMDNTIFRRKKLSKKVLHMTGNWHLAFSATETEEE